MANRKENDSAMVAIKPSATRRIRGAESLRVTESASDASCSCSDPAEVLFYGAFGCIFPIVADGH